MWCISKKHIRKSLQAIMKEGGEGIIMRKPGSMYIHGRSNELLKFKASRGDKEALVMVGNNGVEGADVEVMLPDGIAFTLPSPFALKRGDIVTFTYENYSRFAIPIKPKVTRVRKDLSWEQVIDAHQRQLVQHNELNEHSIKSTPFLSQKPFGFWVADKGKNMRAYFEKYARSRNLDPLLAETWYSRARSALLSHPGASTIRDRFKGSVIKALVHLFEEVGFDQSKFKRVPKSHWNDVGNMRRFFISFADSNGFDPMVADNWYNLPYEALIARKSISSILAKFKGNLAVALVKLFPELGFDPNKFKQIRMSEWHGIKSKIFFDNFAIQRKFNPLVAKNWYTVTHEEIVSQKGGAAILSLYHDSFYNALRRVYPTMGNEKKRFRNLARARGTLYRADANRKFFVDFAMSSGFDPLDPENWYAVQRQQILSQKGSESLLHRYKGSLMRALLSVFPDIGFDKSKFHFRYHTYWEEPENRRKMFLEFAAKEGFDPYIPDNWYPITKPQVARTARGSTLCFDHYTSMEHALISLFPNIGLDKSKFESPGLSYWKKPENKRRLLAEFASVQEFDPNIPENWYSLAPHIIESSGRLSVVLSQYHGSLYAMLNDLFPEKKYEESKFLVQRLRRKEIEVRRNVFEAFANQNGFDPLIAENWYTNEHKTAMLNHKTISSILDMYEMNISTTLSRLFPEILLSPSLIHESQLRPARPVNRKKKALG